MSGRAAAVIAIGLLAAGCGKKGPPLPPLVRLPAAPADFSGTRRGNAVVIEFTVPAANTDGTRPANVSRVDVYAVTAPAGIPDAQVLALGSRVWTVPVKSPRDPNRTIDPEENSADMEPLQGDGLDQGYRARMAEELTADALKPIEWPTAADAARLRAVTGINASALPGPPLASARTYVGVSIDTRGRMGPVSRRVSIPIVAAPPPPSAASVAYTETAVTVTWTAAASGAAGYHVYELPPPLETPAGPAPSLAVETRLTPNPVTETTYTDSRMAWGVRRCYTVRAVATAGALTVESDAPAATCLTLADTFAPAAPKGLSGVASEGSISLIWEPNPEKDLAGYLVLRGVPGGSLQPITPSPIQATVFTNPIPAGVRYAYAIVAVDTAGNRSPESSHFEEAGRN